MTSTSSLSSSRKRDRQLILGAMVLLAALAWFYTIRLGLEQNSMADAISMPMVAAWTLPDFVFMLVMWAVMMFAMMLPSVTPTVMIYSRIQEKRESNGRPFASTGFFVTGYLLAWSGFSLLATVINWLLHSGGTLSSMMGRVSPLLGGVMLVLAGIYQWTPAKDACLAHCRSPMSFLMLHWIEGTAGAVRMGLHHGLYCLGCCWLLMLLLFVLGVMNLPWVALLTIVILVEKLLPYGMVLGRAIGVLLTGWGIWLITTDWPVA